MRPRAFLFPALVLLLAWGLGQVLWGERIPVRGGFGYDGRHYARIAEDFPRVVFEERLDAYRLQRVVPSALVWAALAALRAPHDPAHVRLGFELLNLGFLVVALVAWAAIAQRARLDPRDAWLGLSLLFVNFALLKMPFYYAALTDTAAFALGALLLHFHLRGSGPGMLAVLLIGAFTWPWFLPLGAPLYLFPPRPLPAGRAPRGAATLLGALAALAFLLFLKIPHSDAAPVDFRRLWITLVLAAAYVFAVVRGLADRAALFRLRTWSAGLSAPRAALVVLAVVALPRLVRAMADPESLMLSPRVLRENVSFSATTKPALFLVAHVVYLGLVVPLAVAYWPALCRAAHRLGPGLTLYAVSHLVLAVQSESRLVIDALPALVLLVVLSVEAAPWPPGLAAAAAGLAFLASKAWFPLNQPGEWTTTQTYPAQYYFMNHGPWMSYPALAVQGAAAAALLVAALVVARRAPADPERVAEGAAAALPLMPPARPLPPLAVNLALAAVSALLAALAVEGAARLYAAWALSVVPDRRLATTRHDPDLGWSNRPGAVDAEARLEVNGQGLRGPEGAPLKPAGARRVLLLGDAVAQGQGVAEAESLRARLEQGLRASCPQIEVLDAAVPGYSTDQEWLLFSRRLRRFSPDAVLLLFSFDDVAQNGAEAVWGRRPKPYFEVEGSGLALRNVPTPEPAAVPHGRKLEPQPWRGSMALRLLSIRAASGPLGLQQALAGLGLAEDSEPAPAALAPYGPGKEAREAWRRTERILGGLARDIRADGATLLVAYAPAPFELDGAAWQTLVRRFGWGRRWRPERVQQRLRRAASAQGLALVNLRPWLTAASYDPQTGLWTEAGHAAAARALARALAPSLACR